jgi:pyruvate decarboxylase
MWTVNNGQFTVGSYLATRLEQLGLKHYFGVPGDYNLMLLDALLKNSKLQMINCCNELNAGYAADGYARAHGLGALVVTYAVGGLSALNAVAGAYAEDIPIIVISGAPGTDAEVQNQILHHTEGQVNYRYVRDIFSQVTAQAVIINHLDDAPHLIDQAFMTALCTKKPVYIEIACNIVNLETSAPHPLQFNINPTSDSSSLNAAVEHAASLLNAASKPVLVGGVKLRSSRAIKEFQEIAKVSEYAIAVMPDAKGFVSEHVPHYMGVYWGCISSPGCSEIVESSDLYLFAGSVFTDYTTVGYSALINPEKLIHAAPDYVKLPGQVYNQVLLAEFLSSLAKKIKPNDASSKAFNLIREKAAAEIPKDLNKPITTRRLFAHIQHMLTNHSALIVETGDSWFNAALLTLPEGCGYEIQLQYGSIGWSVGATLGYALASQSVRRVIALIGDGSFQMTAQEISTIIRYGLDPIIILINNGGYIIEAEIHDGPYNRIKNWKYSELVNVFNAEDGNGWGCQVTTEAELIAAIETARHHKGLCLIEVITDKDDCNKNLLEWGSRVAANNMKPPRSC